jgi:hypothetical protein
MASTYENDLRLEEMATGENSGSWGTKTNTNLELIADAFSYGTETIADADTTLTIADGAADAARSLALKINSSVDLTTTRTVTLAPNTTSKVWIIENNTSGGQTLTISAGSGSNITLANGTTKIIATDGIGAGSNVVELTQDLAIADLIVDGDLTVDTDTLYVDSTNDRVGINTSSPSYRLDVRTGSFNSAVAQFTGANDGRGLLISTFSRGSNDDSIDYDVPYSGGAQTWSIAGAEKMRLDQNGNVGIGTSSPSRNLHVQSTSSNPVIAITSSTTGSVYLGLGDTDSSLVAYIRQDNASGNMTLQAETNMLFTTNSAERMRIDSSGNVGIGTSSPSAPLSVTYAGGAVGAQITGNASYAQMQLSAAGANTNAYFTFGANGTGKGIIQRNATDVITIDSSGNVGIGTNSPQGVLDLGAASSGRSLTFSKYNNIFGSYSEGSLNLTSNYYGDTTANAYKTSTTATFGAAGIEISGTGDSSSGLIQFFVDAAASKTADAAFVPSERMRIDASGNVGIGTSSPSTAYKNALQVHGADGGGNIRITNDTTGTGTGNGFEAVVVGIDAYLIQREAAPLIFYTNSTERMRIASSGNVGIGTSSPEAELHIAKSTSGGRGGTLVIENSHSSILNNEVQIAFLTDAGASLAGISNARIKAINTDAGTGAAALTFTTWSGSAEGEAMRIDSSGNVGIGTSSPSYQLDIQGGTTTNDRVRLLRGTDDINQFMTMGWNSISTHRADVALASAQTGLSFNQVGSDGTRTAMQIDSSGNVGIGTSSPNARLEVEDGGTAESVILKVTADDSAPYAFVVGNDTYSTTDTHGLAMWVGDDGQAKIDARGSGAYLVTRIQGTERMRLDASGNLLVGTTSADPTGSGSSGRVVINTANGGQAALTCYNVGTGAVNIISLENGNGQVGRIQINGTTTSYLTSSDYRLKEDWQLMSGASDRVLALKPVNFAWKVDGSRVDGFLAHEVAEVVPEAIAGTKDAVDADGNPEYQGIDQSKLIPLLTAALQEALTKIDALETRITTLEG